MMPVTGKSRHAEFATVNAGSNTLRFAYSPPTELTIQSVETVV